MQQSSFAQGMVSSYQQNLQTTNQQYQSVIWLENFDPNIISGSLVRRAGWVLKNYEQLGNDDGHNNSLHKYVVGGVNNQDILSIGPDDIVLGAFEFQHTRPVIHTMPINIIAKSNSVIVEDEFCTPFKSHLVSYYPIEKNGRYESQWNEPTIHRNIDDGNNTEIVGKVSDYSIYGNIIILVTRKARDEQLYGQNCYPVYIYSFNDAGFDIKHWLNKDNEITNNIKSQFWDIRKNSTLKVINSELNQILPKYDGCGKGRWQLANYPSNEIAISTDGNQSAFVNGTFDNCRDWYDDYENEYGVSGDTRYTGTQLSYGGLSTHLKDVELVIWQSSEAPQEFDDLIYTESDDFLYTCQALEGVDWYPHQGLYSIGRDDSKKTWDRCNTRFDFEFNYQGGPYCEAPAQMLTYPVKPITANFQSATGEKRTIDMYLERPFAQANSDTGFSDYRFTSHDYKQYKDISTKLNSNGTIPFEEDAIEHRQTYVRTYRLMLPNYRSKNMPRQYLPGERIPIVLTAVINGTETEILRTTYIMQDGNPRRSSDFLNSLIQDNNPSYPIQVKQIRDYKAYTVYSKPHFTAADNYIYEEYDPMELGMGNYRQRQTEWGNFDVKYLTVLQYDIDGTEYLLGARGQKAFIDRNIDCFNNYASDELLPQGYLAKIDDEPCCFYNYLAQPEAGYLYFTIKINALSRQDAYNKLPAGLTELKLYVSQSNASKGLFKYNDQGVTVSHPESGYALPIVEDAESNTYRLIKRFIVSSTEGLDEIDYSGFTGASQGVTNHITNCWALVEQAFGPDNSDIYNPGGSGIYAVPLSFRKDPRYVSDDKVLGGMQLFKLDNDGPIKWTPDFCLWDYPEQSEMLSSNVVTEPWEGKGAGLVTNINGISFIGQCQDKDFKEEKAIIRYTELKNNVLLMDVFPELNQLKIGNDLHTALFNYRDQLIVFTRNGFYRVIIQNVADSSTWQVGEYLFGQGVTHIKRVTDTPYGFIFMNDAGIWLSEGSKIENIADPILNTYKLFASIQHFNSGVLTSLHMLNDGKYWIDSNNEDISPYSELVYNNKTDELHCIFPASQFGYREYRFIYAFRDKNWRVESSDLWADVTINSVPTIFEYMTAASHRMHFCSNNGITRAMICNDWVANDRYWIFREYMNSTFQQDMLHYPMKTIVGTEEVYTIEKHLKNVYTSLISHTIGDGVNDNYAHQFYFNAIPDLMTNKYTKTGTEKPTEIKLIQRVGLYRDLPNINAEKIADVIECNNKEGWLQWLIRNSPTPLAPGMTQITPKTRESYKYLFPFGKQFRRSQIYIRTYEIGYIENFSMSYDSKRRRFG